MDVSLKHLDEAPTSILYWGWPPSAASFLGVPPLRIEHPPVAKAFHSNEPRNSLRILILDPKTSLFEKPPFSEARQSLGSRVPFDISDYITLAPLHHIPSRLPRPVIQLTRLHSSEFWNDKQGTAQ